VVELRNGCITPRIECRWAVDEIKPEPVLSVGLYSEAERDEYDVDRYREASADRWLPLQHERKNLHRSVP
jgi:hypothetical protein